MGLKSCKSLALGVVTEHVVARVRRKDEEERR